MIKWLKQKNFRACPDIVSLSEGNVLQSSNLPSKQVAFDLENHRGLVPQVNLSSLEQVLDSLFCLRHRNFIAGLGAYLVSLFYLSSCNFLRT